MSSFFVLDTSVGATEPPQRFAGMKLLTSNLVAARATFNNRSGKFGREIVCEAIYQCLYDTNGNRRPNISVKFSGNNRDIDIVRFGTSPNDYEYESYIVRSAGNRKPIEVDVDVDRKRPRKISFSLPAGKIDPEADYLEDILNIVADNFDPASPDETMQYLLAEILMSKCR